MKLPDIFSRRSRSEEEEWVKLLKKVILRDQCPVCRHTLDLRHKVAHVGSCNANGLKGGFLDEIKRRDWEAVVKPFDRLSTMDLMACEVIHCPKGFALLVWMELDATAWLEKYPVYFERMDEYDLERLKEYVELHWQRFPVL